MRIFEPDEAVRYYARLLLRLHELDPRGKEEAAELDDICDRMEGPWSRLNGLERKRMKGLSQDLYALADGRQGATMTIEEKRHWGQSGKEVLLAGDPDAQLEHLRQPFPEGMPLGLIAFLQARCWEQLGDLEVALVFMQEAGRTIPTARLPALEYLRVLGRSDEARRLAELLIGDSKSRPMEVVLAASTLFLLTRDFNPVDARQMLALIIPPLQTVIDSERKEFPKRRVSPVLEVWAARVLAFTGYELGKPESVMEVCTATLTRYPNDAPLLITRGLARLAGDPTGAEADFLKALEFGTDSPIPYIALAGVRVGQGQFAEVLDLSKLALSFPNLPAETQAALFEWRAIASAMVGQSMDRVEEEFSRALSVDPNSSSRIGRNRDTALSVLASRHTGLAPKDREWAIVLPIVSVLVAENITRDLRRRIGSGEFAELMGLVSS
jgi:hypothetical protein